MYILNQNSIVCKCKREVMFCIFNSVHYVNMNVSLVISVQRESHLLRRKRHRWRLIVTYYCKPIFITILLRKVNGRDMCMCDSKGTVYSVYTTGYLWVSPNQPPPQFKSTKKTFPILIFYSLCKGLSSSLCLSISLSLAVVTIQLLSNYHRKRKN